ncbi:MAG: hypothetical protein PHF87_05250 [Desulfotomaculaceae bacterium]|nr:hypothetical protein [Desulfotomaculaceae bacterium]
MWAVVSLTIIVLAVLLTPISFHAQGCLADKRQLQGEISWLGGLTSFNMIMAESGNVFSVRFGFWSKRLNPKIATAQKEKIKETKKEKKVLTGQGFQI